MDTTAKNHHQKVIQDAIMIFAPVAVKIINREDVPDWNEKCDKHNLCRVCKTPLDHGECPACKKHEKGKENG